MGTSHISIILSPLRGIPLIPFITKYYEHFCKPGSTKYLLKVKPTVKGIEY